MCRKMDNGHVCVVSSKLSLYVVGILDFSVRGKRDFPIIESEK